MSRIPPLIPSEMSSAQRGLYATIAEGRRAEGPQHFALTRPDGSLAGPFGALLLVPPLGEAVQGLGEAVRYETTLTARERELAILIVAAHWNSSFEQMAHESVGRAVGLTDAEIRTLRDGGLPPLEDARETACTRLAHCAARGDVDDATWRAVTGVLTPELVFEITTLVGYYALLALQLRVFRVEAEA